DRPVAGVTPVTPGSPDNTPGGACCDCRNRCDELINLQVSELQRCDIRRDLQRCPDTVMKLTELHACGSPGKRPPAGHRGLRGADALDSLLVPVPRRCPVPRVKMAGSMTSRTRSLSRTVIAL